MIKSFENENFVNDVTKKQIITTISSNTINAFIIGGSKGLGKKNFIFKLCKFMLCHLEINDKISFEVFQNNKFCLDKININKSYHLFENNSHPDFFYLSKEENNDGKKIPIENVRNLKSFFYSTFSISKVKIAVINTIEDLSLNSLNLLLKTIEELPKNSYIFIISDTPVNILETIKSRCAFFYINSLSKKEFDNFICQNYEDKSEQEILFLKNVSVLPTVATFTADAEPMVRATIFIIIFLCLELANNRLELAKNGLELENNRLELANKRLELK